MISYYQTPKVFAFKNDKKWPLNYAFVLQKHRNIVLKQWNMI